MKDSFISQSLLFKGSGKLLKFAAVFHLGINFVLDVSRKKSLGEITFLGFDCGLWGLFWNCQENFFPPEKQQHFYTTQTLMRCSYGFFEKSRIFFFLLYFI